MRAVLVTLVASLIGCLGMGMAAPASAQAPGSCGTGGPVDYPPAGPNVEVDADLVFVSGSVSPGQVGNLQFSGASPGVSYAGVLNPGALGLGPSTAAESGSLGFTFDVPSSFTADELQVDVCEGDVMVASVQLCRARDGSVVASNGSCTEILSGGGTNDGVHGGATPGSGTSGTEVDGSGATQGPGSGALPHTGLGWLDDAIRAALVLLAAGAALVYWRRRRTGSATA